jgi:hypothetical protein
MATNFYGKHFVPDGWLLDYKSLSEEEKDRCLYLTGKCNICSGFMKSGTGLPLNSSNSHLINSIWYQFLNFRPYFGLEERKQWYFEQDIKSEEIKYGMFAALFHEEDQETVREWLTSTKPKSSIDVSSFLILIDSANKLRAILDKNSIPSTKDEVDAIIGAYDGHDYGLATAFNQLYRIDKRLVDGEVQKITLFEAISCAFNWLESLCEECQEDDAEDLSEYVIARDRVNKLLERLYTAENIVF